MALGGQTRMLIDKDSARETAARGQMLAYGGRGTVRFPETHALREIAAIMRESHREPEQIELGVTFRGNRIKHRLLPIDLSLDGRQGFLRRCSVAKLEEATQATGDRTPLLAVVPADAADGADRDPLLDPRSGREC